MSKIISSYQIVNNLSEIEDDSDVRSVDPVVKIPIIEEEPTEIEQKELFPKATEPKLQLTRNDEGIVVGIEVECTCGEKMLIRLDYKI
jgi:hypothetical protein